MTVVRRIARPLLAAVLVDRGVDAARHPGPRVEAARPLVTKVAGPLHLPDDPEMLVRANGAAMAGAGALFALGRMPRLTGLVLVATMAPSAYVRNQFWKEKDPEARKHQKQHFLADLGLLGGALLASVDTEGRPGLAYRTKRAGKDTKRAARLAKRDARRTAHEAKREARLLAHRAGDAVPFS